MSATELKAFLSAMELVRQANTAALEMACNEIDEDGDLDENHSPADSCRSITLH